MKELLSGFDDIFYRDPQTACFAPGRVNLIGEHTDYNGGYVFPCAINRGIYCAASRRKDSILQFYSESYPAAGVIGYHLDKLQLQGCWADYPASVIRAFAAFGYYPESGADFYFRSDLPEGAGLSSSAALEISAGIMLRELFSLAITPQELAVLGQFAENRFIGVNCGIMDQFASAMGKNRHAVLLDANTLSYRYAPLGEASIIIVNSGVRHSLAASAYNDRRRECERVRNMLNVAALCSLSREEFDSSSDKISDEICYRRARHAVYENQRTLDAEKALLSGDYEEFGKLMNASHISLRDDYEVSCSELDFLTETAQKIPGVYGSRMTGGGFGGCTVNLMEKGAVRLFTETIKESFETRYGRVPEIYTVTACNGAEIIEL